MLAYTIQLYKNAYTGLSKNSWYLSIVMLINRSGTMVVPFLSIYCIQQLHFSIVQAGSIMALFGAGALTGAFLGGKLVDKIGFYDLQVGALLSGGLFFILLGFLHSFIILAIGTFILSLCNESFRPANSTAIAHYSSDSNKTRSYSLNRLAINLGWAVGGALGGFLASVNYHLLFWVDGCSNILAAILLLLLMPRAAVAKTFKKPDAAIVKKSAYKDSTYLTFIVLATLFAACFYQFMIMQPVFFKLNWHFSERFIGFLMALNGVLIAVIEMVMVHNLEGKRNKMIYIFSGVALGSIGYMLLNILSPGIFAAIIVVIIITFSEMLAMPFMNSFWISRSNAHNRGEYAALYSMSWSAAQIIAPFLGSNVIFYGGFTLLWWVLGAVSMLSAIGYWWMYYHSTKLISNNDY
jgi:predicted MFS family arabinose efflux permease